MIHPMSLYINIVSHACVLVAIIPCLPLVVLDRESLAGYRPPLLLSQVC